MLEQFQSTLPARGATPFRASRRCRAYRISIHAPCTGSDAKGQYFTLDEKISIHAPCTGSDAVDSTCTRHTARFQSTLPARGATMPLLMAAPMRLFQSTLPARGATFLLNVFSRIAIISIHAPCTGSDGQGVRPSHSHSHFNPRSLHGERPVKSKSPSYSSNFNPRSLHGERPFKNFESVLFVHFNPRSLHGERLVIVQRIASPESISIHAPCTGSDSSSCKGLQARKAFQSTLPARGATRRLQAAGGD